MSHGHPVVDAAWRELLAVHRETGGGDGLKPNRSPEYLAAQRVWLAVLDAHREIISNRVEHRRGKRSLEVVK